MKRERTFINSSGQIPVKDDDDNDMRRYNRTRVVVFNAPSAAMWGRPITSRRQFQAALYGLIALTVFGFCLAFYVTTSHNDQRRGKQRAQFIQFIQCWIYRYNPGLYCYNPGLTAIILYYNYSNTPRLDSYNPGLYRYNPDYNYSYNPGLDNYMYNPELYSYNLGLQRSIQY